MIESEIRYQLLKDYEVVNELHPNKIRYFSIIKYDINLELYILIFTLRVSQL